MKKSSVPKLYDRLNPNERLNLILHAQAREDKTEASRLWKSAPMKNYQMRDARVVDLYEASERCALTWAYVWTHTDRTLAIVLGTNEKDKKKLAKSHKIPPRGSIIARLAGLYEGLERFCDQVGIEVEVLIKAWVDPVWEEIQAYLPYINTFREMYSDPNLPICEEDCCSNGQEFIKWADTIEKGLCEKWPGI